MTSKPAFLKATTIQKIPLCTRSQLKGGVTYVRARARVYTYVCGLLGGRGLIIEANIPVQELEGQRGEGAYFRRGLIFGRIRYMGSSLHEVTTITMCDALWRAICEY